MVMVPGPYHREDSETPASMAAVSVNGLNAEPACLPVPPYPFSPDSARFTCDFPQFLPPYMARTSPVFSPILLSGMPVFALRMSRSNCRLNLPTTSTQSQGEDGHAGQ